MFKYKIKMLLYFSLCVFVEQNIRVESARHLPFLPLSWIVTLIVTLSKLALV